jgi:DNA-binding response OmpR family regulator
MGTCIRPRLADASHDDVDLLERRVYNAYRTTIVAGKELPLTESGALPDFIEVRMIEAEEAARRLNPSLRFPRQVRQVDQLLDVILNVKDNADQRRSLSAHIQRLRRRFAEFARTTPPEDDDATF